MIERSAGSPRERMIDALEFSNPDKIPVIYHESPAGLHVHGQKLLDLFEKYPPDNPLAIDAIPSPPPGTINDQGEYSEIRRDKWGTEWKFAVFGIAGHPHSYPFDSWEEAERYVFPKSPAFENDHFPRMLTLDSGRIGELRRNYLLFGGWVSLLEKLHALRPIDQVLMDIWTKDSALIRFLDRLVEYWTHEIDQMSNAGIDVIMFGDDWGTQTGSFISPELFREVFKPRYERLMSPVFRAGRKVFFHTCGWLGDTFDDLIDLGIDGLWPQIGLYESDLYHHRQCIEKKVSIFIHPDRQYLIPRGSPREIDETIRRYAERYHELGGGGIFYLEMENDAPFENVEALFEAVNKYR